METSVGMDIGKEPSKTVRFVVTPNGLIFDLVKDVYAIRPQIKEEIWETLKSFKSKVPVTHDNTYLPKKSKCKYHRKRKNKIQKASRKRNRK